MDQDTRLYCFGCTFLWWVLTAFDYLIEGVDSAELDQRYQTGYVNFGNLAEWLLDEVLSAGDREDIEEEEASAIYSKVDDFEPLVLRWKESVSAAAHIVSEDMGVFDEDVRVYYFACGWSLRTLSEFGRLLENIDSPGLYQQYQEARAMLEDLAEWLQNELSWVVGRPGVKEKEHKTLQARMETLTEQLAIEWHEKVYELAKA